MNRIAKERDRLLAAAARVMGMLSTLTALLCVVLPNAIQEPWVEGAVAVLLLLALLGFLRLTVSSGILLIVGIDVCAVGALVVLGAYGQSSGLAPNTAVVYGLGIIAGGSIGALGTIVIVQEYDALNPVSLNQLMLQEMTKVSVQAGAKLMQQPATRKLSDGTELTGLRATVKTRTDSTVYEVFSYGGDDRGVMFVTRIADENVKAEGPLIDKFWETLRLKL